MQVSHLHPKQQRLVAHDVFVDAEDLNPNQPGRVGQPTGGLGLDRVPAGVSVDPQVTGQR